MKCQSRCKVCNILHLGTYKVFQKIPWVHMKGLDLDFLLCISLQQVQNRKISEKSRVIAPACTYAPTLHLGTFQGPFDCSLMMLYNLYLQKMPLYATRTQCQVSATENHALIWKILQFFSLFKHQLITKWYQNGTIGTLRHCESDYKEVCPGLSWFVQVCPWFVLVCPGLGI